MNKLIKLTPAVLAVAVAAGCSSNTTSNETTTMLCALGGAVAGSFAAPGPGTLGGAVLGAGICYDVPADSDGDGINDAMDKCPGTPEGVAVNTLGCPLDGDNDGVADYLDQCPDTPEGVTVDETGCEPQAEPVAAVVSEQCKPYVQEAYGKIVGFTPVHFAFDRFDLSSDEQMGLNCVAGVLKQYGNDVSVQGHTDSVGRAEYNYWLGERRAEVVVNYLVDQGVSPSQLSDESFGPDAPAYSNSTDDGRAMNRRTEIVIK